MVRSEEGERIKREYEAYFGNEEWRKAWEQAKKDARKSLLAKVARMEAATEMHTKYKDLEERYKERITKKKAKESVLNKIAKMKAAEETPKKYKDLENRYKEKIQSEKEDKDDKRR